MNLYNNKNSGANLVKTDKIFADLRARRREKIRIVFCRDMRVTKNTLRGAPVRRRRAGSAAKAPQKKRQRRFF